MARCSNGSSNVIGGTSTRQSGRKRLNSDSGPNASPRQTQSNGNSAAKAGCEAEALRDASEGRRHLA